LGSPDLQQANVTPPFPRSIAICVIRDGDRHFVARGHDHVRNLTFYRPLGGTIEFGETGAQTVVRELMEETGHEVRDVIYLGTLENLYTFEGEPGHEIVLVYEARFADVAVYRLDTLECREESASFTAVWMDAADFHPVNAPLYPDGLLGLLAASGSE
jgi:8-oxo-dGTP pyrophosphatase MutT (NUDIX family)